MIVNTTVYQRYIALRRSDSQQTVCSQSTNIKWSANKQYEVNQQYLVDQQAVRDHSINSMLSVNH